MSAEYCTEAYTILRLAWKLCIMNFMKLSVEIISYGYVGRLGDVYLSAAGLANVTANVTGMSILAGLAGALSTLCGQAYGAKNYPLLNELLQRSVLVMVTIATPLAISWIFSEKLMNVMGQDPQIAQLSSSYLKFLIPALFAKGYSQCLEFWLTAQQQTEAPATIGVITAALHPLWCYLFIFQADMHYLGSALAISFTRSLESCLFTLYVIYFNRRNNNTFVISSKAAQNLGAYLKLGLPNVLMFSQW